MSKPWHVHLIDRFSQSVYDLVIPRDHFLCRVNQSVDLKWEALEVHAVHNFRWGIQRCFTFYQFEKSLHPLIRSSNLLERFFRGFRNESGEIGAFPN